MQNKGLLDVIESLMEAEMTKKDPIKNPQEEKDEMEEETGEKLEKAPTKDSVDDKHADGVDPKGNASGGDGGQGDPDKEEINKAPVCNEEDEMDGEEEVSESEDPDQEKINKQPELKSGSGKVAGKDGKMNVEASDCDEEEMTESEDPDQEKINKQPELKSGSGKVAGKDGKMNVESADESDDEEEMEEAADVTSGKHAAGVDSTGKPKTVAGDPDKEEINKAPVCNEEDEMDGENDEVEEELKGGQKKLDVDNDGDIDADDLADLRAGKKKEEEYNDDDDMTEALDPVSENDDMESDYDGDGKLDKHEKDHEDEKDLLKSLDKDGDGKHTKKDHDEEEMEEDLDEDFKTKAAIIFETVVNEKANAKAAEIQEEFDRKLEEEIQAINEKVSEYIDYAVSSWLKENQLEIKYSLRTEISENFIRGLKTLFNENYIDIPEEEVSVVDELTETVESYKEQLEEQTEELEKARKEILQFHYQSVLDEITEDLTQSQAIKLEKIAESIEAVDIEEFRFKVEQLKETYFESVETEALVESLLDGYGVEVQEEEEVIPENEIDLYARFLGKTIQK